MLGYDVVDQPLEAGDALDLAHVQRVPDLFGHVVAETSPFGQEYQRAAKGSADLEAPVAAGGEPERHDVPGLSHLGLEVVIERGDVHRGPVGEMDGLVAAAEVAVHLVGREGAERREQLRHRQQALVQRAVRGRIGVLPEPWPRPPHIPVRQVVDEPVERLRAPKRVVALERVRDFADGSMQARADPPVEHVLDPPCLIGRPTVEAGVGDEERIGVPEREEEPARRLVDAGLGHAARRPR